MTSNNTLIYTNLHSNSPIVQFNNLHFSHICHEKQPYSLFINNLYTLTMHSNILSWYITKKAEKSTSINTFIRHAHHLLMGVSDEVPPNSNYHPFHTASQILLLQITGVQLCRRGGQAPRAKELFEVINHWKS